MDNEDPFNSLTIHSDFTHSVEIESSIPSHSNQINSSSISTREKLQVRRKDKNNVGQSTNTSTSCYKLTVKYGGYFKPINNGAKQKYYSGKQKTIYLVEANYSVEELLEKVSSFYTDSDTLKLTLLFVDKHDESQSFIQIEDDSSYELMLSMYEVEKKIVIYVVAESIVSIEGAHVDENVDIQGAVQMLEDIEYESDYCYSENSYDSLNSENDDEVDIEYEGEFYSYDKDDVRIDVGAHFPHVIALRRALSHYAIINDFEFELGKSEPTRVTATCASRECNWRIHATVAEDGVTFVVRTLQPKHSCLGVNRSRNKHVNKGWIADRIVDVLREEGDISAKELKKRIDKKFSISLPYNKVWKAKELALVEIYGKWDDSLVQIGALKEEILKRNPGSVVELKTEPENGIERHFQ